MREGGRAGREECCAGAEEARAGKSFGVQLKDAACGENVLTGGRQGI
jgi:hypothetical protein